MNTFESYLQSKKIDAKAFQLGEPTRFAEWEVLYSQVHVASFEAQKKFLINPIRRKFPLPVHDKS